MSHDTALFMVNPLFYEALSGEFTPASDAERRHTLGRLATATFHKSKIVELGGGNTRGDSYYGLSYSPSWDPGVTASVSCLEMANHALFRDLVVWRGDGFSSESRLGFSDGTRQGREQGRLRILRPGSGEDEYFDLTLGDNLTVAKKAVTELAQEFFSRSV